MSHLERQIVRGYYSPVYGLLSNSQVENIDPALGGVGGQGHRQVRFTVGGLECDVSYEQFAKDFAPVFEIPSHKRGWQEFQWVATT